MRRIGKMVDFRDIPIAATAIEHQMPLKTLNTKHFVHIPDLELV
jgi:predicted nucleic acid-binding protein